MSMVTTNVNSLKAFLIHLLTSFSSSPPFLRGVSDVQQKVNHSVTQLWPIAHLIHLSDPTLCKADGKIGNTWGRKEEKQRKASNSVGDGQGWVFLRGTVHTIAFYSNLIHTTWHMYFESREVKISGTHEYLLKALLRSACFIVTALAPHKPLQKHSRTQRNY